MSSSDNSTDRRLPRAEPANPFVAFRRFADEQVSSLLQSVIGLPSAFNGSSSTSQSTSFDDDAWLLEARELRRRLACEAEEAAKMIGIFEKGFEGDKPIQSETDYVRCPYRPIEQDIPQRHQEPISDPVSLPFYRYLRLLDDPCELDPPPFWPVLYAVGSPYSPLRLEHQEHLRSQGDKWRNAFEDLMALQNGKSMAENDDRKGYGNGASWIISMVERGSFGKGWQRIAEHRQISESRSTTARGAPPTQLEYDEEEDEVDQMRLYERFLGTQYPSANSSAPQTLLGPNLAPPTFENEKPSLLSTLTTTERNKLPDGSTHTKVVLKKRFSDGREESTETVHTAYDSQQSPKTTTTPNAGTKDAASKAASDTESKTPKQKGWFWS